MITAAQMAPRKKAKFTAGWRLEKASLCIVVAHPDFAYIRTQAVAGVAPNNILAVLQSVGGAAIVGKPLVHFVHPTGLRAAVKLIQMVDALDIVAFVQRRVAVFNLQVRGIPFCMFR